MIDTILHAVTNRSNFATPLFASVSGFVPITPTPAAAAVMSLLHLDAPQHDYYVHAALAAIDAYPEIREAFREGDRSFEPWEFQRTHDAFQGFTPVADAQGPFVLARVPQVFPVDFNVGLTYLDPDQLGVTVDGAQFPVRCSVGSGTLYPLWPQGLGVSGGLALSSAWDATWRGGTFHMPIAYPFAAVAALLDADTNKNELLLRAGLIEHYAMARGASEKLATVLLALGLANKQLWT